MADSNLTSSNTQPPTPPVPSSLDIHIGQLPDKVKLIVLKEYIRLWATRVPIKRPIEKTWDYSRSNYLPATNRAKLVHLQCMSIILKTKTSPGYHTVPVNVGWCAKPGYLDRKDGPNTCDRSWYGVEYYDHAEPDSGWPEAVASFKFLESVRISHILGPGSCSKVLRPVLEEMFFGDMIWEFSKRSDFEAIANPQSSPAFPRSKLVHFRRICLVLGSKWEDFIDLFEYVLSTLQQNGNPMPNLISLEIKVREWDPKRLYISRSPYGGNYWQVLDERIRVRYLVTKCYRLVQRLPNINIGLSGLSKNSLSQRGPRISNEAADRAKEADLGYSWEDTSAFFHGTSWWAVDLPHLEFLPDEAPVTRDPRPHAQWKMLFKEKWAQALQYGIDPASQTGDIYGAVSDSASTLDVIGSILDPDSPLRSSLQEGIDESKYPDYFVTWKKRVRI